MRQFVTMLLMLLCLPAMAADMVRAQPQANLTILTDENMLLPLAQLARSYATQTNTPCTVVLKNAEDAAQQIEQGLEAHVLITANQALIGRLTEQGLTDVTSRRTIARTQLALVTAGKLSDQALLAKRISFAAMLAATPNLPVLANAPASYEGARVDQLLSFHAFSEALAARIDRKATHDEVIETLRDTDALALVLATDAATEPDMHVLALLPEDVSPPVLFEAVVLGSEAMEPSKQLANYLSSRAAQQVFARFGFQPPVK